MADRLLADLAFVRSGDKGDTSDVSVFVRRGPAERDVYALLADQVTPDRVATLLRGFVHGPVRRYDVPGVLALKFVMEHALAGGGPASLRADNLGKALGGALLRLTVEVPAELEARVPARPRPPRDPYAGAGWLVPGSDTTV